MQLFYCVGMKSDDIVDARYMAAKDIIALIKLNPCRISRVIMVFILSLLPLKEMPGYLQPDRALHPLTGN
jgi:hypothetical protein